MELNIVEEISRNYIEGKMSEGVDQERLTELYEQDSDVLQSFAKQLALRYDWAKNICNRLNNNNKDSITVTEFLSTCPKELSDLYSEVFSKSEYRDSDTQLEGYSGFILARYDDVYSRYLLKEDTLKEKEFLGESLFDLLSRIKQNAIKFSPYFVRSSKKRVLDTPPDEFFDETFDEMLNLSLIDAIKLYSVIDCNLEQDQFDNIAITYIIRILGKNIDKKFSNLTESETAALYEKMSPMFKVADKRISDIEEEWKKHLDVSSKTRRLDESQIIKIRGVSRDILRLQLKAEHAMLVKEENRLQSFLFYETFLEKVVVM